MVATQIRKEKEKMKKSIIISIILVVFLVSVASGFQVTGKQKILLQGQGLNNDCIISISNYEDISLVALIKPVKQYYAEEQITFSINENWLEKKENYKWREVEWILPNEKIVNIAPNSKEDVVFSIATDENITKGTFYAQFETKDITQKQGTIVIRVVYVTQIVGAIEKPSSTILPGFSFLMTVLGLFIITFLCCKLKHLYIIKH